MNSLNTYGELLTAAEETLTLTYRLLPYGEDGHTNMGTIRANKGSLTFPEDMTSLELNEQHDANRPIGFFESLTEDDSGLTASVRLIDTQAGRDSFKLAKAGLRKGISVEIANPVIRDGVLQAGRLTGAGLVVKPAFASAQLTAADCGDLPIKENQMENTSDKLEAASAEVAPVIQAAPIMAASTKVELGSIVFDAYNSGKSVQAALADQLTTHDIGKTYIKDQEVGELWEARKTERKLVNTIGVKPLTGLIQTGSKKQRTFAVADWAGNKVELPTGTFTTSRESWEAKAKAVAVDVAVELIEFGGEGVLSDAYDQAMDSYIEQTEAELLTYISSEATAVSAAFTAVAAIDKASETLGAVGANMSFIMVSGDVMAALRSIKAADAPWWLTGQSSVNLRDRSIDLGGVLLASNSALPAKTILVGDSRAVDYRESKDLKFRALDVAHGGVDISFIKFRSQYVTDNGAILKFTNVSGA